MSHLPHSAQIERPLNGRSRTRVNTPTGTTGVESFGLPLGIPVDIDPTRGGTDKPSFGTERTQRYGVRSHGAG